MGKMRNRRRIWLYASILAIALMFLASCDFLFSPPDGTGDGSSQTGAATGIEAFRNHEDVIATAINDEVNYFEVNGNKPVFTDTEKTSEYTGTHLSELDALKRVGAAWGSYNATELSTDDREPSLDTEPTGWHQNRYDGQWLMNRCHLIGYQISGLNDEPRNLMSGTRSFNVGDGMVKWENLVANHMKEFDGTEGYGLHHVMYRIKPDFHEDNLLAHGIYMEADCLECDEIDFNVYVMNREPGVTIDYRTGDNWANGEETPVEDEVPIDEATYVINTNSDIFHKLDCSRLPDTLNDNYDLTDETRDNLVAEGYKPCGSCKP